MPSHRLDSELLLTHVLQISRTSLHAHPELELDPSLLPILDAVLGLRVLRVPLAYIIGHREFYGRLFRVTPSVLIPRPETEDIVDICRELPAPGTVIDVGTGSGALAVTLALEFPQASMIATDISQAALAIAESNASAYDTAVEFIQSDLLDSLTNRIPAAPRPLTIVANLPYVDEADPRSPETSHEPGSALFAGDGGIELIGRLIGQSATLMRPGDHLILESNPAQQPAIARLAHENGFAVMRTRRLISVLVRG